QEAPLLREERERALERADAHLARRAVRPVLRLERVGGAAARVVRGADRALARAAGALLAGGHLGRAGDGGPLPGGAGGRATGGELGLDHLVEEVLLHLGAEDLVGEIDLADALALEVVDGKLHGLGPS